MAVKRGPAVSVDEALDAAITGAARDAAREAASGVVDEIKTRMVTGSDAEYVDASEGEGIDPELEHLFPQGEDFYGKIHKEMPDGGTWQFKREIENISAWVDPESEISKLVRRGRWGTGRYRLMVFKRGARGRRANPLFFDIDGGEAEESTQSSRSDISEVVRAMQSRDTADPQDIRRAVAESFSEGVRTVKESMGTPQDIILQTMKVMSENKPASDAITTKDLIGLVTAAIPVIVTAMDKFSKPKEEDFLTKFLQMQQAGIIETPKKEDPTTMMARMIEFMEVAGKLTGGGTGAADVPAWMEAAKIFAPQVPKVLDTVNKVVEYNMMKMGQPIVPQPPPVAGSAPTALPGPEAHAATQSIPLTAPKEEVEAMHPAIKEIYDAVQAGDVQYYAKLELLLKMYVNPEASRALASGDVDTIAFLTQLQGAFGNKFFTEQKTIDYFKGYIEDWKARNGFNDEDSTSLPPGAFDAVCSACKERYTYEAQEDFDVDHTCECGGEIVKIEATQGNGAVSV